MLLIRNQLGELRYIRRLPRNADKALLINLIR